AWYAIALERGGGAHERAGGGEEHPLPDPFAQAAEAVSREDGGRAAAAGASGLGVVGGGVVDEDAAVGVGGAEVEALHTHELADDVPSQEAEVACDDGVIV